MSVQYVRIYYGPYQSFFTLSHKPQKLRGLKDHLQKLGFRVDTVPVEYIDYCMIEMCGYEIFRCNIKNLSFNMPAERDQVCRRAVNAVVNASAKLTRARTYIWVWGLIESETFRPYNLGPNDYWPIDANIQKLIKPLFCIDCCTHHKETCRPVP